MAKALDPHIRKGLLLSFTKGNNIRVVRTPDITPADLITLFYAALENVPDASIAMQLALEKFRDKYDL